MRPESLASLLARWEECHQQGQDPTPEALCGDQPDLIEPLRQAIEGYRRLRQQAGALPDSAATVSAELGALDPNVTMPPSASEFRRDVAVAGMVSPPGYEILGELGRGGMGVVYKARQAGLNRLVALKMILSGGHAGEGDRARFLGEAEAIARIRHPGIVQVHDFGMHDGLPFFSLELCEGGSLADKLAGTPLPPGDAARVVELIARAVDAAHQAGVVHRDLKPANVLLGADGSPRVTDFGLAKRVEGGGHTQTGAVMGTPSYMAPEQAEGKKEVGPPADVYAVGAILYECLSGRPPFRAATTFDTILQVVSDEPVSLRQLNAKVPADLETICVCCLQKDPAKRYASAAALADDLRRWLDGEPVSARRPGPGERLVKWARRKPAVAALLATVVAVLAAGVTGVSEFAVRANQSAKDAREAADLADRKAAEAEHHAQETLIQQQRAEENAKRADLRAKEAVEEKRKADEQRDRAEDLLYASQVQRAYQMWADGLTTPARDVLDSCRRDRRGWEHRFLHVLFDRLGQHTFHGHTGPVHAVAVSPDGARVASGGGDAQLKVWYAGTGVEAWSVRGHGIAVRTVAFSPDGTRLVTGGGDSAINFWDAATGQLLHSARRHTKAVTTVAYSRDGRRVASASWDRTIKVWDAATGLELHTLPGHTQSVNGVAFSPDGRQLVSGGSDNTVRVWDTETGEAVRTLPGHTFWVTRVAFSPDGTRFASASNDGTVKVWDAVTLLLQRSHPRKAGIVTGVAFSPDGRRLVSNGSNQTAQVWDAETGQTLHTFHGHANGVTAVAFSPDGRRVVTGGVDTTVKVWDAGLGQQPISIPGPSAGVLSVAFDPTGTRVVAGGNDNLLRVWDSRTGQHRLTLQAHAGRVSSVAFSPAGSRIVSGSWDKSIKVWDAVTGRTIRTLPGHSLAVTGVAYSHDGRRIVSVGNDNRIRVWDAESGDLRRSLDGRTESLLCVAANTDGSRVATGSEGGGIL